MEGLATQLVETFLKLSQESHAVSDAIAALDSSYGAFTLGLNDTLWRAGSSQPAQSASTQERHQFWASEILSCLDHRHDGDGRDSWQMAGLLVVPQTIIDQAKILNDTKTRFAALLQKYRQLKSKKNLDHVFHPEKLAYQAGTGENTRDLLRRIGQSRVHLRHATRHIVCLKEYPKFVSLSWVRQRRSIQKISFDQCMQKLLKLERDSNSSHIQQQIQTLNKLDPQDYLQLRLVQTVAYPSIKTKVYWNDGSDSHLGYLSLPALVPEGETTKLPAMTDISPTPPAARAKRRSDNKLPEEPLCPSIRVFLAEA